MEYERVQMDEEGREDIRYRQAMLKRWRLSMFFSFVAGVLVTTSFYRIALPCVKPEVIAEMAAAKCPVCAVPDTKMLMSEAISGALSQCPKCKSCRPCPAFDPSSCPVCPACKLECPKVRRLSPIAPEAQGARHEVNHILTVVAKLVTQAEAASGCPEKEPDAVVAARNREAMLARPMKNIIECKPGQECRMGAENRFKVLGQKGVTLWMTGLSGAGKTTICKALEKKLLLSMGKNVFNIDGGKPMARNACGPPTVRRHGVITLTSLLACAH